MKNQECTVTLQKRRKWAENVFLTDLQVIFVGIQRGRRVGWTSVPRESVLTREFEL